MMKIHNENLLFSSKSPRVEFLTLIGLTFKMILIRDIFEKSRGNVNAIMRARTAHYKPPNELVTQVRAATFCIEESTSKIYKP